MVIICLVHPERSGFDGCSFGAHPFKIHLAAGPDVMHLMLEGLAKTLIDCIAMTMKNTGNKTVI